MKGLQGKVIGGAVTVMGAVGLALTSHVVDNGALPVWLSKVVALCIEFALFEVPIPAWFALSAITLMAGGALFLAYTCLKQIRESDPYTDELKAEYRTLRSHCKALEKSNSELNSTKTHLISELARLNTFNSDLTGRNSEFESDIARLTQTQSEIPALAFKLLATIAEYTDANVRPSLYLLFATLRAGNVEAHAALDILLEQQLLSSTSTGNGNAYAFTPKGRAYYLKHKEQNVL